jgi:archaellum component FlaC
MRSMNASDNDEKLNDLTTSLEDLTTTVEELEIDPPADLDPASLNRVKDALEDAVAATDDLEDQREEANAPTPKE